MGEENLLCFFFFGEMNLFQDVPWITISNARINATLYSNLPFCLMCVALINLESLGSTGLIM